MYDNLESLGNTPEQVEQSLGELGLSTTRLSRADAREMLNKSLDGTTLSKPALKAERDSFIETVLSNNCVINGSFHIVTIDGVILGCPLTLGLNLPDRDTIGDHEEYEKIWTELWPAWGSAFYQTWDSLLNDYAQRTATWDFVDAFVFEGE